MKDIDPKKEAYALKELQHEIDREMKHMTTERGRELLKEVGVMLLSGWDISSTIVFDSFLKIKNETLHLINEVGVKIYTTPGFNPNNTTIQIWELYPPGKKPSLVDHDQIFGHLLVQRVG